MLKWHQLDALQDAPRSKYHATADNTHPILGYISKKLTYKEKNPVYPVLVTVQKNYHDQFTDLLAWKK